MKINVNELFGNFAQDKDLAKMIRTNYFIPEFYATEKIILDFKDVDSSTQSLIHALVSEIFQKYGEEALEKLEFENCSDAIKSLITTVINYSLE
ncbi:STAS-like domain-containing protein [Leptospira alstonii]|uniref:STAS-like domain-containing protein n=1 Tax=Leptospira alstonii TaxID=28452 RepID=UPI00077376B3|nr:DUF4325 domain-containing protein [Leptospira alstonii]